VKQYTPLSERTLIGMKVEVWRFNCRERGRYTEVAFDSCYFDLLNRVLEVVRGLDEMLG
jgi:hypothetical protein